jgi:hypothetical protein
METSEFAFDGASCLLETPPQDGEVPIPKTLRATRDHRILSPCAVGFAKTRRRSRG